jgi:hypothetical protein
MGRKLGTGEPGGGAAGEGEEHGVGGPNHGAASDGELELPEKVGPEAAPAHADTSRHRDGRAAAVALAARGGDREPDQPLLRSIFPGGRGQRGPQEVAAMAIRKLGLSGSWSRPNNSKMAGP